MDDPVVVLRRPRNKVSQVCAAGVPDCHEAQTGGGLSYSSCHGKRTGPSPNDRHHQKNRWEISGTRVHVTHGKERRNVISMNPDSATGGHWKALNPRSFTFVQLRLVLTRLVHKQEA